MSLENTVGKGEIARNEQFLLFPQCFLPILRPFSHFYQILNCCLQTLLVWKSLKFVVLERVKTRDTRWQFIELKLTSLPRDKILNSTKLISYANEDFFLCWGRKYFGKTRKCWLPAFVHCSTMFSKKAFSSSSLQSCLNARFCGKN